MKKVLVFLVSLVVLTSCATTDIFSDVALPDKITITPPSSDVPPQLAGYSGKWKGIWGGELSHILIVEEITPPTATVIYAVGDSVRWRINRAFIGVKGKFQDDGSLYLELPNGARVAYRPRKDFQKLDATYELRGFFSRATLEKEI